MKPITKVLERLSKVKHRKADQWMACCPAHDDRDPSLSIKEAHDGKVLLHCWSGCTADDIVAAIGLELSDLFEPSDYTPKRSGPSREAVAAEVRILENALRLLARGERLPQGEAARVAKACLRLGVSHDA